MKKTLRNFLLAAPLFLAGCSTWSAGKSFDAGRAGAKTLEAAAQITCEEHDILTAEQKEKCKQFEIAAREIQAAIDNLEEAWEGLAPIIGIKDAQAAKVAKSEGRENK